MIDTLTLETHSDLNNLVKTSERLCEIFEYDYKRQVTQFTCYMSSKAYIKNPSNTHFLITVAQGSIRL